MYQAYSQINWFDLKENLNEIIKSNSKYIKGKFQDREVFQSSSPFVTLPFQDAFKTIVGK